MKNIKEKLYQDKKLFISLCLLALTTVFFALFLFLYGQFHTATLRTLTTFNSEFIERVNTISGTLLNNINNSAMQMFYTSSVSNLRTKKNLTNAEKILGHRDLGNFVSSSDFLDSIMVYNSKLDMIFTSEGGYTSTPGSEFHDTGAVEILTNPENYPYLVPIKRKTDSGFCYSFLFFEVRNAETGSLLINIDDGWYESQLLGISGKDTYVIVDGDGELIASSNEDVRELLPFYWPKISEMIEINPSEGFFIPSAFSTASGWMYQHMEDTDWYYLKTVDLASSAPGLIHIRNFLFVFFGLISGVIILFLAHLLIKVYFPFYLIRNALSQSGQKGQNVSLQVEELIKHQRENTRTRHFSLLRGGSLPPEFSFPVLLIMSESAQPEPVQKLFMELCSTVIVAPYERGCAAAFPAASDQLLWQLDRVITEQFHDRFCVSSLCRSGEDLKKSHSALDELQKLHILYPEQQILHETLLAECNEISGFRSKEVSTLITALKAGQAEAAFSHWGTVFASIQHDKFNDFRFALRYLGKQVGILQGELGLNRIFDIDPILDQICDISMLHQYMEQQFQYTAEAARQKKNQQLSSLSGQIEQFILTHYTEDSFSAQQVAEHFQMNTAYLSRQYHQISGISISDAIHRIRIDQARLLLEKTDEPAELIAQRVGYSNIKYFFVIFKKWTGFTPKQYRMSVRS